MNESAPQPAPTNEGQIPAPTGEFDNLVNPDAPQPTSVEDAAVRTEVPTSPVAVETERQMGIAAADRKNREEAGLPPRTYDLR